MVAKLLLRITVFENCKKTKSLNLGHDLTELKFVSLKYSNRLEHPYSQYFQKRRIQNNTEPPVASTTSSKLERQQRTQAIPTRDVGGYIGYAVTIVMRSVSDERVLKPDLKNICPIITYPKSAPIMLDILKEIPNL